MANNHPMCARCAKWVCVPRIKAGEPVALDDTPPFCPMRLMPEVMNEALSEYDKPKVREFARLAAIQEFQCYEHIPEGGIRTLNSRIEEVIQFARKCEYKRLGIAFCLGLAGEASILTDILEDKGFEIVSVCCKSGAVAKERIGVEPDEKITGADKFESMCNPILQAEVLNASDIDMALMLGLCVGHDTLFIQYCKVPMTVIAVKDRVFGHNPLAALYLVGVRSPYYSRLTPRRAGSRNAGRNLLERE